ncbi:hypothetical protein Nepgr_019930 [Nepenthes gracilis]|uniref:U1-type domain-containing protein n=1 Tax=Nepenthes gracilis TaxID=150966 RepID=A0AAD3XVJ1_NEPGR|nr:hypothetical protein Nepgr_019930 [Nepenthes gracilis]
MVWFQCEDCGENLKKPKLPNHFRMCSATKLSCIDCGEIFGQQSVQGHTQCITEEEKYGPKGQGNFSSDKPAKSTNDKRKLDFDVNVGLSERPPWFCSLCNTQATSKQTLLLHAEGKKHRAKSRAFHASNQQSKPTEKPTRANMDSTENTYKNELLDNVDSEANKNNGQPIVKSKNDHSLAQNGNLSSKKRKKIDASEDDGVKKKIASDILSEFGNGDDIHAQGAESNKTANREKKAKQDALKEKEGMIAAKHDVLKEDTRSESELIKGGSRQKIKLKKLITSTLKSTSDGILKMRKLQKLVLKALMESGIQIDDPEFNNTVKQKLSFSLKTLGPEHKNPADFCSIPG